MDSRESAHVPSLRPHHGAGSQVSRPDRRVNSEHMARFTNLKLQSPPRPCSDRGPVMGRMTADGRHERISSSTFLSRQRKSIVQQAESMRPLLDGPGRQLIPLMYSQVPQQYASELATPVPMANSQAAIPFQPRYPAALPQQPLNRGISQQNVSPVTHLFQLPSVPVAQQRFHGHSRWQLSRPSDTPFGKQPQSPTQPQHDLPYDTKKWFQNMACTDGEPRSLRQYATSSSVLAGSAMKPFAKQDQKSNSETKIVQTGSREDPIDLSSPVRAHINIEPDKSSSETQREARADVVRPYDIEKLNKDEKRFVLYLHLHGLDARAISEQLVCKPFCKKDNFASCALQPLAEGLRNGFFTKCPPSITNGSQLKAYADELLIAARVGRWHLNISKVKTGVRMTQKDRTTLQTQFRRNWLTFKVRADRGDSIEELLAMPDHPVYDWHEERRFLTTKLAGVWKIETSASAD